VLGRSGNYSPVEPGDGHLGGEGVPHTLVDDSDPDTELSQIEHLMQCSEASAPTATALDDPHGADPRLGKILCLFGEPQWAVVGDTFPVGLPLFRQDRLPRVLRREPGQPGCEYQIPTHLTPSIVGWIRSICRGATTNTLPRRQGLPPRRGPGDDRYHSFYPCHRDGEYANLMSEQDHRMMDWVRKFNPYDLYSKGHERPDVASLTPYYQELIANSSRQDRLVTSRPIVARALLVVTGVSFLIGSFPAATDRRGLGPPQARNDPGRDFQGRSI